MPTNQGGLVNQIAPFEKHGFVIVTNLQNEIHH
jgi:hypothetical protein